MNVYIPLKPGQQCQQYPTCVFSTEQESEIPDCNFALLNLPQLTSIRTPGAVEASGYMAQHNTRPL